MKGRIALTRRSVLAGGVAAAFTLAIPPSIAASLARPDAAGEPLELQPLISIFPDGRIEIVSVMAEMGQGVFTALPLILADEMDADWDRVEIVNLDTTRAVPAPRDSKLFVTADSHSTRGWYTPLRKVAATARAKLAAAAAAQWGVSPSDCRTHAGEVIHPDGEARLGYGTLAAAAAAAMPNKVTLKTPDQFTLIGKVRDRRDVPAKCTGAALYASDIKLPGLLHCSVSQGPYGAEALLSFDDKTARADPRVRDMFVIDGTTLVAVALDTWSAMKALEVAAPKYRMVDSPAPSSTAYKAALKTATAQPGRAFSVAGTPPAVAAAGDRTVDADYMVAFLAHATMEPMSCTAWFHDGTLELWAPTQVIYRAAATAVAVSGLPDESVVLHQTLLGGGFGRRSENDFIAQATAIAMRVKAPIRLQWSRTEDTRRDYYRSAYAMRCKGSVNAEGAVTEYGVTISGPSLLRPRVALFDSPKAPIDPTVRNGLVPAFYNLPNTHAAWVEVRPPIPIGFWRSVANSQNAFAAESFIDELAHAAGKDPFDFRQALVTDERMSAVLTKLRTLSDWDSPLAPGRARGLAIVACYESYIGQVLELSVTDNDIRVHRATNVIDCGIAVQPSNIVAQIEGGTIFGLSAALYGDITFENGVTQQSSFTDYRVLLLGEAPTATTFIMPSDAAPGGVGETGVPCAAPASANALFALTGKRLRTLPLHTALFGAPSA